jgi:hypothetical protein
LRLNGDEGSETTANGIRYKVPQDGEKQEGDDGRITIIVLYMLTKREQMWLSVTWYIFNHMACCFNFVFGILFGFIFLFFSYSYKVFMACIIFV